MKKWTTEQVKRALIQAFNKQFGFAPCKCDITILWRTDDCTHVVFYVGVRRWNFKSKLVGDGLLWVPSDGLTQCGGGV